MNAPSPILARKLAALRRKQTFVSAGTGLAAAVAGLTILMAASMLADWWFELPWAARLIVLAVEAAVIGLIVVREVARPIRQPLTDDDAALLVEHHAPHLRSRLISAVQLPGTDESQRAPSIVGKLVAEAEELTAPIRFPRVVSARGFAGALLVALVVTALAGFAFVRTQPASTALLQRALLATVPVPRKTHVECVTRERTIARGESILLEAIAHGVVPPEGKLTVRYVSGRRQTHPMLPSAHDRARFARNLENVLESFTYWVQLNDGTSESYRVIVEPQPVVSALKCVQSYPAYTGLPPQPRALGDLALLAGSELQLEGIASKPLKHATVRLVGLGQERPLAIDPQNPRLVRGGFSIPAGGLTGFAVPLLDQRGLRSRDEVVYRIDIVPDRAPTLNLTYPTRKEELVTAAGTLLVAFEASDDFGIQAVALHYKVGESGRPETVEMLLQGQTPRTMRRRYEWKFATLQPPPVEDTMVEYWLEARDNNNVTGPGITTTDHYFAKVVSEAEKRADLFSRFDENLSLLGNIAENQEKLNAALGDLIRGRPAGRTP